MRQNQIEYNFNNTYNKQIFKHSFYYIFSLVVFLFVSCSKETNPETIVQITEGTEITGFSFLRSDNPSLNSDINLVIALHKYELNEDEKTFLFEVPLNSSFIFQENKKFIKLNKRRKRYICKNLLTGRKFLFSPVARVKINN